jgi:hypothetical protein
VATEVQRLDGHQVSEDLLDRRQPSQRGYLIVQRLRKSTKFGIAHREPAVFDAKYGAGRYEALRRFPHQALTRIPIGKIAVQDAQRLGCLDRVQPSRLVIERSGRAFAAGVAQSSQQRRIGFLGVA